MGKARERFAYLPQAVLESAAYTALRTRSPILLSLVAARYTGRNNGDLVLTYSEMYQSWRWARDTTARAYAELRDHGLLVQTRKGGRNRCSLYALAWLPIDEPKVIAKIMKTGGELPGKNTGNWREWSNLKCVG